MSAYTSSFVPIFDWVQWGWQKSNQCDNGAHYAQTSSVSALLRWCPKNRDRADLNDTFICIAGTRGFTLNINWQHNVLIWIAGINVWKNTVAQNVFWHLTCYLNLTLIWVDVAELFISCLQCERSPVLFLLKLLLLLPLLLSLLSLLLLYHKNIFVCICTLY